MKLNSIELKGFKSFKELKLDLFNLNILIGPNGAGKSNFLSFFKLLNQIVNENLREYTIKSGGVDYFMYYGRKTTEEIELELKFEDNFYYAKLIPSQKNSLMFDFERIGSIIESEPEWDEPRAHEEIAIGGGTTGRFGNIKAQTLDYLKKCIVYHFRDTSESSKMKSLCDINDNEILRPDGSNLAAYLFFLRESHFQHYKNIVDTIKIVMPSFNDFNLRPHKLNKNKIILEWREKGSDSYFDANYLSDGSLRFICLATLLLQPELPEVILIDEPELGLHPYAITLLADMLKSASAKTQVIISTQSVTLVNQFEPKDIIVVNREAGFSAFKRLAQEEIKEWLDDYSVGDLWEKNVIGGRPA